MSALPSIRGSWIPSMPMRGKAWYDRRYAFPHKTKFRELVENSYYMPFQKKRGYKHGVLPFQEHHRRAKKLMSKIKRKEKDKSILDRFQRDATFYESQLAHGWTDAWCKYLYFFANIDISHQASPEQRNRYNELYHLRYDSENVNQGQWKPVLIITWLRRLWEASIKNLI